MILFNLEVIIDRFHFNFRFIQIRIIKFKGQFFFPLKLLILI